MDFTKIAQSSMPTPNVSKYKPQPQLLSSTLHFGEHGK